MKLWQISTKICTVDSPGPGVFWIQNPNGKSKRSLAVAEKWKWVDIISTETIENEPQIIRAHGVVLVAYLHACSAYWEGSIWIQSADRSRTLGTAGYSWVHMSGVNNNNSITTRPGVPTLANTIITLSAPTWRLITHYHCTPQWAHVTRDWSSHWHQPTIILQQWSGHSVYNK